MLLPNIKTLMVFLIVAVSLNIANYVICWFYYNPDTDRIQSSKFDQFRLRRKESGANHITLRPNTTIFHLPPSIGKLKLNDSQEFESGGKLIRNGNYLVYVDKFNEKNCPEIPPELGPIFFNESTFQHPLKNAYTDIGTGGLCKVKTCIPRHRAAIIVPVSGKRIPIVFINYIHSFLQKQQLEYQMFLVQQSNPTQLYNRGKLLNAAFTEVHRRYHKFSAFNCFIIHDPNIVPVNTMNLYRCSWYPKQLTALVEKYDNSVYAYEPTFGGAVALTIEQYIKVNGFSNSYSNNDADFYDMFKRLTAANYTIERTLPAYGKYVPLQNSDTISSIFLLAKTASPSNLQDGLTSLSYSVNKFELRDVYTYIKFNLPDDPAVNDATLATGIMWKKPRSTIQQSMPITLF